jgi:hypothetical protein
MTLSCSMNNRRKKLLQVFYVYLCKRLLMNEVFQCFCNSLKQTCASSSSTVNLHIEVIASWHIE